jgi:NAD(P)-dependent dehydrogenase (short-subunit alcohol dehydrogenase family)
MPSPLKPVPLPDLSGKVALVTGASRGLGKSAAEHLLRAGATVYAGTFTASAAPEGTIAVKVDVTDDASVNTAVERVVAEQGRLDIMINNAGAIEPIAEIGKIAPADANRLFDINITGVLRGMQAALPHILKSGGTIVNAGSGAAFHPLEGWGAYCASKAALVMLTRVAAVENEGKGIKIFVLGIPASDTDMQVTIRASGINRISQMKREDLPHADVTGSIMAWLCGEDGRALNDVAIDVRDERLVALMG